MVQPNLSTSRFNPGAFEMHKSKVIGDSILQIGQNLGNAIIRTNSPEFKKAQMEFEEMQDAKTSMKRRKEILINSMAEGVLNTAETMPGEKGQPNQWHSLDSIGREKYLANYKKQKMKELETVTTPEEIDVIARNWAKLEMYSDMFRKKNGVGAKVMLSPTIEQLRNSEVVEGQLASMDNWEKEHMTEFFDQAYQQYQMDAGSKPELDNLTDFNGYVKSVYGPHVAKQEGIGREPMMTVVGSEKWQKYGESFFDGRSKEARAQKDKLEQIDAAKVDKEKQTKQKQLQKATEQNQKDYAKNEAEMDEIRTTAAKKVPLDQLEQFNPEKRAEADKKNQLIEANRQTVLERKTLENELILQFGTIDKSTRKEVARIGATQDWEALFKSKDKDEWIVMLDAVGVDVPSETTDITRPGGGAAQQPEPPGTTLAVAGTGAQNDPVDFSNVPAARRAEQLAGLSDDQWIRLQAGGPAISIARLKELARQRRGN